ncbi:uncharacterized protein LOC122650569 [Telopea speciosissima]|uniref:uncharacterized protein LOC122650569 n=1 Tax=Telopea speciosissima TaxID=54955 RepID=UPI001CC39C81|nr:uncharacterized protein LOC122650569 [Telopea speciosissima]
MAALSVQSTPAEKIKLAQISVEEFQRISKAIKEDAQRELDFTLTENSVLMFRDRLCVPSDTQLRKGVLSEAHDSPYPISSEWKWKHVTMDFVTRLPRTPSDVNAMWVVDDRLTKTAHFIPVKITYSMDEPACLYIDNVI